MASPYYNAYAMQAYQQQQAAANQGPNVATGGVAAVLTNLLDSRSPKLRNQGVFERLDKLGDLVNAIVDSWNASVTAGVFTGTITVTPYDKADFTD